MDYTDLLVQVKNGACTSQQHVCVNPKRPRTLKLLLRDVTEVTLGNSSNEYEPEF